MYGSRQDGSRALAVILPLSRRSAFSSDFTSCRDEIRPFPERPSDTTTYRLPSAPFSAAMIRTTPVRRRLPDASGSP